MKTPLYHVSRALTLLAALAATTMSAVAQDAQLASPAAVAARTSMMADQQVDAAGCVAPCPSCGCAEATCGCADGKCCGPDCCQKRCVVYCEPDDYVCCPKTEKETVKKECFTVECEAICIPKFKLPWECCCKPKCGRIRCVNVLGKDSYECEECVTTWEAKRVRCSGCGSGGGCAGGCGCGDSCCGDGCCEPGCGCCATTDAVAPAADIQTVSAELPAAASTAAQQSAVDNEQPPSRWSKLMWWKK
ncbi:MAG: hypothetical protein CMJ58_20400 [Planctomycetaceae bacterium]|nr:hypothetical protein [Planctomycetaceae bacterium]